MCLIIQEICCSSQVLKPWRLDQEISEEGLFIKAGQIPDGSRQIAIYRGLMILDSSRQILSIEVSTATWQMYLSRITKFRFLDLIFGPCWHVCVGFSFLTTLNIYKAYFKGHHIGFMKISVMVICESPCYW